MIFIGDIAIPNINIKIRNQICDFLSSDLVIANLEGALTKNSAIESLKTVLFNDYKSTLVTLKKLNIKAVSLANNHIFDIANSIIQTKTWLSENDIYSFGAGYNLKDASTPLIYDHNDDTIIFLGYGWDVIGCKKAKKDSPGVSPLHGEKILNQVSTTRKKYPQATIIIYMHWGYELELYPLPKDRKLAFTLIDNGANAVIGSHSHCVQGIEIYKDAPVCYSLGNWYVPSGYYWKGKLVYPSLSSLQLAFQWDSKTHNMTCHWFDFSNNSLRFMQSEPLNQSTQVIKLTPFKGMDHLNYCHWFKQHRRKKKLLPIYYDYKPGLSNYSKDSWNYIRTSLIQLLILLNFKKGPK